MSTFSVLVKRILAIEPHPNADAIEFAVIDGYRSIIKKGQFQASDLVAYIPESALLPEWLLKELKLWEVEKEIGKLNGKRGNRVKAIKLRGELSQGICYEVTQDSSSTGAIKTELHDGCFALVKEGDNVAELLGITKYEPEIPVTMAGEVFNAGTDVTLHFDLENIKSHPSAFKEDENVVITEKIHGTCTVLGLLPYAKAHPEAFGKYKNILIFSKGLGAKGLVFKNNEANKDNLYIRSTKALIETIDRIQDSDPIGPIAPEFILGETFGPGIQDLTYGKKTEFRTFAYATGYRGAQRFHHWKDVEKIAKVYGIQTVPVLYKGPYSEEVVEQHTNGKTTLEANHIREGVVIVPEFERNATGLGRLALKSVSEAYLLRKGATEYT
jgi:RNA ligase (TIGR02306 family)